MRIKTLAVVVAALTLFAAGCGGDTVGEEIAEQLAESGNGDISNVDIDTSGDDFNMTIEGEDGETINVTGNGDDEDFDMTIEGDDGETINVTGSGDDDDFTMVIEGEDGESMVIGGGDIPEGMTTPVPDGGDVISSITSSGLISVGIEYPGSMFDELVELYDGVFSGDGVQRIETSSTDDNGDPQRVLTWMTSDGMTQVSVADCEPIRTEGDQSVCVSVMEMGE